MSQEQVAREYRIAVSGPPAVGKSALTVRFTQLLFVDEYDPTIEDSYKHYATIDDKNVLLDILDTLGQEDYASMKESYMRRGEGFLLVFSVTSMSSFESIQLFYDQIIRVKEDSDFVPIILIGNKTDLSDEREVDEAKLIKFAKDLKIPYIETSAKVDLNVNELFYTVVKMINKNGIVYPFSKDDDLLNNKKESKDPVELRSKQKTTNETNTVTKPNENKDKVDEKGSGGCCIIM